MSWPNGWRALHSPKSAQWLQYLKETLSDTYVAWKSSWDKWAAQQKLLETPHSKPSLMKVFFIIKYKYIFIIRCLFNAIFTFKKVLPKLKETLFLQLVCICNHTASSELSIKEKKLLYVNNMQKQSFKQASLSLI